MLTFQRHRTVEELRALCPARGLTMNTDRYDRGGDHVVLSGQINGCAAVILFNTFNSVFWGYFGSELRGETPDFSSGNDRFDDEPWFQNLLRLFYIEKADCPISAVGGRGCEQPDCTCKDDAPGESGEVLEGGAA